MSRFHVLNELCNKAMPAPIFLSVIGLFSDVTGAPAIRDAFEQTVEAMRPKHVTASKAAYGEFFFNPKVIEESTVVLTKSDANTPRYEVNLTLRLSDGDVMSMIGILQWKILEDKIVVTGLNGVECCQHGKSSERHVYGTWSWYDPASVVVDERLVKETAPIEIQPTQQKRFIVNQEQQSMAPSNFNLETLRAEVTAMIGQEAALVDVLARLSHYFLPGHLDALKSSMHDAVNSYRNKVNDSDVECFFNNLLAIDNSGAVLCIHESTADDAECLEIETRYQCRDGKVAGLKMILPFRHSHLAAATNISFYIKGNVMLVFYQDGTIQTKTFTGDTVTLKIPSLLEIAVLHMNEKQMGLKKTLDILTDLWVKPDGVITFVQAMARAKAYFGQGPRLNFITGQYFATEDTLSDADFVAVYSPKAQQIEIHAIWTPNGGEPIRLQVHFTLQDDKLLDVTRIELTTVGAAGRPMILGHWVPQGNADIAVELNTPSLLDLAHAMSHVEVQFHDAMTKLTHYWANQLYSASFIGALLNARDAFSQVKGESEWENVFLTTEALFEMAMLRVSSVIATQDRAVIVVYSDNASRDRAGIRLLLNFQEGKLKEVISAVLFANINGVEQRKDVWYNPDVPPSLRNNEESKMSLDTVKRVETVVNADFARHGKSMKLPLIRVTVEGERQVGKTLVIDTLKRVCRDFGSQFELDFIEHTVYQRNGVAVFAREEAERERIAAKVQSKRDMHLHCLGTSVDDIIRNSNALLAAEAALADILKTPVVPAAYIHLYNHLDDCNAGDVLFSMGGGRYMLYSTLKKSTIGSMLITPVVYESSGGGVTKLYVRFSITTINRNGVTEDFFCLAPTTGVSHTFDESCSDDFNPKVLLTAMSSLADLE